MQKRITFVENERGIKIVHLDGKPFNGSLQGFYNNRILIYFDYKDQSMVDEINKTIYSEFMVKEVMKGDSTKEQFWIEWTINHNPS